MTPQITYASGHPSIVSDRMFFAANPHRRFRARAFVPGEGDMPANVAMFGQDHRGELAELILVILVRTSRGRVRRPFAKCSNVPLNTDAQIEAFLRSRGVEPSNLYRATKR